jgi:hypothetical protein
MADDLFNNPAINARIAAGVLRIQSDLLDWNAEPKEPDLDSKIVTAMVETLDVHARAYIEAVNHNGLLRRYTDKLRRVGSVLIENAEQRSLLSDPYSEDRLRKIAESSGDYIRRKHSLTPEQQETILCAAIQEIRQDIMPKASEWRRWKNEVLVRIETRFEARYRHWSAEAIERVERLAQDTVGTASTSPVFISYSWDTTEHKEWVLGLATRLRGDGINAVVDQTHLQLGERSTQFMERFVRDSRCVLVVCTEKYKQRFNDRSGGAGYEGHIITGEIVSEVGANKFIPVLRGGTWKSAMPTALSGTHGVDLSDDSAEQYSKLVNHLRGVSNIPPLGRPPNRLGTNHADPQERSVDFPVPTGRLSESSLLPSEDVRLVSQNRGSCLAVWLKNETLEPIERCSITLSALQRYSAKRRDFERNPCTPLVLIMPETINAGHANNEAATLARWFDTHGQFLKISTSPVECSEAGIWLADITVEAAGRRRRETLFFRWRPGEEPEFIGDPRLSDMLDLQGANKPVPAPDDKDYWEQRKRLQETDILKKICAKPRWRIWIRPVQFRKARFQNLEQCRDFMRTSYVRVKGWFPYPWFSTDSIEDGDEWVSSETDKSDSRVTRTECWALFRSCQFVHNRAFDEIPGLTGRAHVLEILDTATGAIEFAARMAGRGVLSQQAAITFELDGVDGLTLTWPDDKFGHADVIDSTSWCQDEEVSISKIIDTAEILGQRRELALEIAFEIYSKFGWSKPPRERLAREQDQRFGAVQQIS